MWPLALWNDFLSNIYLPWSGGVTQSWAKSQFGLVNIVQQMKSNDADLETEIVTKGFSYGRQLGRINEALEVVARHLPELGLVLKNDQRDAIDQFLQMTDEVAAIRVGALPLTDVDINNFIREMRPLKVNRPYLYEDIRRQVNRLRERLEQMNDEPTG